MKSFFHDILCKNAFDKCTLEVLPFVQAKALGTTILIV